jgi:hypothetical protein
MSTTTPSGSIAAAITVSNRSTPDLPTAGLPCFYGRLLLPAWDGPAKPRVRLARMKLAHYTPPVANTTLDGTELGTFLETFREGLPCQKMGEYLGSSVRAFSEVRG